MKYGEENKKVAIKNDKTHKRATSVVNYESVQIIYLNNVFTAVKDNAMLYDESAFITIFIIL